MTTTDAREALATALGRIEAHVPVSGPAQGLVEAYSFADALISALAAEGFTVMRMTAAELAMWYPERSTK